MKMQMSSLSKRNNDSDSFGKSLDATREERLGALTFYGKFGLGYPTSKECQHLPIDCMCGAKLPMYSSGVMTSTFMMGSSNDM